MSAIDLSHWKDLLRRTGSIDQLGSVREVEYTGGRTEGIKAYEIYTAAGLHFNVLESRCLDIYNLWYKGIGIPFLSKPGLVAAQYADPQGVNFKRSIAGGMLYTCGLTNAGNAYVSSDRNDHFHGRIRFTPAEHTGSFSETTDGEYRLGVRGEMRDAGLFMEHLVLKREVSTSLFGKTVSVRDTVENRGFESQEFMLLYHLNCGYPMVDKGIDIYIPSAEVMGMNPESEAGIDQWSEITDPVDGFKEHVFVHTLLCDPNRRVHAGMYNRRLGLGIAYEFDADILDRIVQWKSMMSGDYVLGIFPSNNSGAGRGFEEEHGTVKKLEPFEKLETGVEVTILEGEEDLGHFLRKFVACKSK